jgi:3-hydroxybutyryl-CoA dehydratase
MSATARFKVGDDLRGPVRCVTPERIQWYDSAMLSAATNELRRVGSNIHTDEEYAKSQGFAAANADGMIMTNWCSEMLLRTFGLDYLERGELRTKYIKPTNVGVELRVKGRITDATEQSNGNTLYAIDVWCEDERGTKLVDGDAKVEVARGGQSDRQDPEPCGIGVLPTSWRSEMSEPRGS